MADTAARKPTIEALISRLEEITRTMEKPDTGLEGSIALYEEGIAIAEQCRKRLQAAKTRIELINPETAPEVREESAHPKGLFDLEP
ncbi:exodeoxyribonuclease VII small subunit [Chlorobium sp. N1]|uniref:exodeoxyribonuclease VII small subunit n=1 Tax=Chlorobium sp. N1 TaxID=2491138 RepID=UPI00103C17E8|nr:exodeoxyribonuclease VII small subunit [Chlorobium sp. N1]TCD47746.1 exodeoxyribonuclease VII small subunit [Chlorobium sp. N1]